MITAAKGIVLTVVKRFVLASHHGEFLLVGVECLGA
jgi:hypothetical protein